MQAVTLLVQGLILKYGYLGIFVLTTFEQFIFPIPTDFFLIFALQHGLSYGVMMTWVVLGCILGGSIGYVLGRQLGSPALKWLVGEKKMMKGEMFIKKWGLWGVVLAALTPIPFKIIIWTAGILKMPFKKFLPAVIIGHVPRYFLTAYLGSKFFETKFYASTGMSALILGAVQGFTEFFPISSSGHLVVMEHFLHVPIPPDELSSFDIFLHGGSLLAIMIYFRKEWLMVLKELWGMLKNRALDKESLAFKLFAATLPAVFAGLILGMELESLRSLHGIGICFILVGLFYFYVTWKKREQGHGVLNLKKAIIIGLVEAVSLVPGVSRSGLSIGTGISLGLDRETAAKFSFMLGGMAILAANVYNFFYLKKFSLHGDLNFILLGTITAFITSLLSISLLIRFFERHDLKPFAIYLILAGSFILSFL